MNTRFTTRPFTTLLAALAMFAPAGLAQVPAIAQAAPPPAQMRDDHGRVAEEKTGSFVVRDGQRLRLIADLGNIRVRTQNSGQVSYRVRIEADAGKPEARLYLSKFMFLALPMPGGVFLNARVPWREMRSHLGVTFELNVPRNFQLEVSTQSGNIEIENIDGRVVLATGGGNITAGRVGGAARLETQGGHITVQDVSADLVANSAGGHISVGNVQGAAVIHTGGGHIRVASVQGTAQLETGGGNISLGRAGAGMTARTSGGRIDLGEASGTIRAFTGGGNIGVLNVAGATQIDSGGGSICLTQVQGPIRASTATGSITAYFLPVGKSLGPSQLESGAGDIVVFIPRELAISIEATVEALDGGVKFEPAERAEGALAAPRFNKSSRIVADPGILLKMTQESAGSSGRVIRAEAALNGGGEVLHLKTATGRIHLRYSGALGAEATAAEVASANVEPNIVLMRQQIEFRLKTSREEISRQVEAQVQALATQQKLLVTRERVPEMSRLQSLQRRLYALVMGRVRVDSAEQKQRLMKSVSPEYPLYAKQQNLEGLVRLEVYISSEGVVEEVKVVSGSELFVLPAVDAVKQWRYTPLLVGGKAVPVVTTVDLAFRMH